MLTKSYALRQTLLPKIVELWERLHVPLVHRSRFFLAFRGRETFYYEVRATGHQMERASCRPALASAKQRMAWLQVILRLHIGTDSFGSAAAGDHDNQHPSHISANYAAQPIRQAEQRRLAWMVKQLDPAADAEEMDSELDLGPAPDTPGGRTAQRKLEKAARRLEVPRKTACIWAVSSCNSIDTQLLRCRFVSMPMPCLAMQHAMTDSLATA